MTPRGSYRSGLEKHLGETRDHAERVRDRLRELGHGGNPIQAADRRRRDRRRPGARARQDAVRPPARLRRRGEGPQERQGRRAPPRPWRSPPTPRSSAWRAPSATTRPPTLAASIRADEEQMLARDPARDPEAHRRRRPRRVKGDPSYDLAKTGAADAARDAGAAAKRRAKKTAPGQAHRAPGPQGAGRRAGRGPGQGRRRVRGRPRDRPLRQAHRRRDHGRLAELSQIDLAKIDAYERKNQNRTTILEPHHLAARRRAVGRATTS